MKQLKFPLLEFTNFKFVNRLKVEWKSNYKCCFTQLRVLTRFYVSKLCKDKVYMNVLAFCTRPDEIFPQAE